MVLGEDEIVNAICLFEAERKQLSPTQIEVELIWDEDTGFSAEATAEGRSRVLIEANMLEAIERYLLREYERRVFRSQIRLGLDEEMYAEIDE